MRFILVDRILEFKKGKSVIAVKNVSLSEDFLVNHASYGIIMSHTYILEATAQAAGWLITASLDFKKRALLVALRTVNLYGVVRPGDQLILEVEIESLQEEAAMLIGRAKVEGEVVVEVDYLCTLIDANQLEDSKKTKHMFFYLKNKEHFYE